jgi:Zn-dependent peptidase ImmA (M78 family)
MSTSANGQTAAVLHESIEALLAAHPGEQSPEKIMRRLAREKVACAKSYLWSGPPYCPKELASLFGIKCREVNHDIDGDGRILLRPNGKIEIEYRSGRMPARQRFTIFHEFAHTLFPDYCTFLPCYHRPNRKQPDPIRQFEHLCDVGASEMLLPADDFMADLSKLTWLGFESVFKLQNRYHSSIDATIYRMIDLATSVGFAAAFLTDQRGDNSGYGPLWIKHISKNALFKSFVPGGTTPPSNSVAIQCYRNKLELSNAVKETWWINGSPRTWFVQAAQLPAVPEDKNYPKVVALLFPSGYWKNYVSN